MTKRLFTVRAQIEMVVIAENEVEAGRVAKQSYRELSAEIFWHAPEKMIGIPSNWEGGCLPYGEHEEKTISEWLLVTRSEVERDAAIAAECDV